jgi:predicted transcriptional regulator
VFAVKVSEIMSFPVVTVAPESGIKVAARLLAELGVAALPVIDYVVGILSRRDLMKVIARPDDAIKNDIVRALTEADLAAGDRTATVAGGVATIDLDDVGPARGLAESVALNVAGVLEVRFADHKDR